MVFEGSNAENDLNLFVFDHLSSTCHAFRARVGSVWWQSVLPSTYTVYTFTGQNTTSFDRLKPWVPVVLCDFVFSSNSSFAPCHPETASGAGCCPCHGCQWRSPHIPWRCPEMSSMSTDHGENTSNHHWLQMIAVSLVLVIMNLDFYDTLSFTGCFHVCSSRPLVFGPYNIVVHFPWRTSRPADRPPLPLERRKPSNEPRWFAIFVPQPQIRTSGF